MSACYVILVHITWVLAREWTLFIRAAKTVTWVLSWEWVLARDTTVRKWIKTCCCDDHLLYACVHLWCCVKNLAWSSRGTKFKSQVEFFRFFIIRSIITTLIFSVYKVGGVWV